MISEEFLYNQDNMIGYCLNCKGWTRENTEGDATEYDCPDCGMHTVIGADNVLLMELVEIEE